MKPARRESDRLTVVDIGPTAEGRRMAWCRQKLQATIDDPPPPRRFDSEVSVGNERWDSFAAECGVLLLAADPSDVLARKLVGAGLVAFNYNTTALTMVRAVTVRTRLEDAFEQMVGFAVQWAALRPLQARRRQSAGRHRDTR
jgi:hypothetical protein